MNVNLLLRNVFVQLDLIAFYFKYLLIMDLIDFCVFILESSTMNGDIAMACNNEIDVNNGATNNLGDCNRSVPEPEEGVFFYFFLG